MRTLYAPSEPQWSTMNCPECGEHVNEEELAVTDYYGSICEPCAMKHFLVRCAYCGDWVKWHQIIDGEGDATCTDCNDETEREI